MGSSNGHDLIGSQFIETRCSAWCPSQHCSICANFTSFSNNDVTSCGHDNKATQMGMENACTKFNPKLSSKNSKTGVSCFCKETRCYCYCVLQDCVCNYGIALKSMCPKFVVVLTLFMIWLSRLL